MSVRDITKTPCKFLLTNFVLWLESELERAMYVTVFVIDCLTYSAMKMHYLFLIIDMNINVTINLTTFIFLLQGDSGSGVTQGNTIIGLVSGGIPCARGYPDVKTGVYPFVSWIRSHVPNV